jgi:branched-chain amino acid transport system ATP-binding protein
MLSVRQLEVFYGPIRAVRGIDLDVRAGEIVALIGANGSGKTSTLRAIAGLLPFRGEVAYQGRTLVPNKAEVNLRAGLSLVPEGRGMLGRMRVEDNLRMGIYARSDHAEAVADIERMFERFPILKERRAAMASLLSGGEQQMLAIARILRTGAKMLLLDEPTAGMSHVIVQQIGRTIREIKNRGFTVLLVEQNFRFAATVADRHYVMEHGKVVDMIPNHRLEASMDKLHEYLGV